MGGHCHLQMQSERRISFIHFLLYSVAVLVVLVSRLRRAVGAAVRRVVVDDEVPS